MDCTAYWSPIVDNYCLWQRSNQFLWCISEWKEIYWSSFANCHWSWTPVWKHRGNILSLKSKRNLCINNCKGLNFSFDRCKGEECSRCYEKERVQWKFVRIKLRCSHLGSKNLAWICLILIFFTTNLAMYHLVLFSCREELVNLIISGNGQVETESL